jgi:hypothetical protein
MRFGLWRSLSVAADIAAATDYLRRRILGNAGKAMNSTIKILSVLAALAATPAWATEPDAHAAHHPAAPAASAPAATANSPSMNGGSMMGGEMMNMGAMSCAGMGAGRLAAMKADLALTPAQLPLWNAFVDSAQAMGQAMGMGMKRGAGMTQGMPTQPGTGMMGHAGSLAEGLDRHEAMLTAHLDEVRSVKATLSRLYVALTSAQRAKVDAATMCSAKAGRRSSMPKRP